MIEPTSPLSNADTASPRADDGGRRGARTSRPCKSTMACDRCRLKKIKCDGSHPCQVCLAKRTECCYSSVAKKPRRSAKDKVQRLQQQLQRAELLLREYSASASDRSIPSANLLSPRPPVASATENLEENYDESMQDHPPDIDAVGDEPNIPRRCSPDQLPHQGDMQSIYGPSSLTLLLNEATSHPVSKEGISQSNDPDCFLSRTTTAGQVQFPLSPGSSSASRLTMNYNCSPNVITHSSHGIGGRCSMMEDTSDPNSRDEIHGPNSYLSICVDPGMVWITNRIGESSFVDDARSMMSTIGWALKLHKRPNIERTPEPDKETALKYAAAYFDESLESTYSTIDRQTFEKHLLQHFDNSLSSEQDAAWYALRNVVYASGCRIVIYRSQSWIAAQTQARLYFENALSVEMDLIHGACSILAIQALLCMALFAEGADGQKLEYMLISCALRLACAKGLHLRPNFVKIPPEEDERRRFIFWTIYCFEKHLALRSGRPSAIDDDDIGCEIPTFSPDGNENMAEYFKHAIRHARLTSQLMKSLMTVKARKQPAAQLVKLVQDFDQRLRQWYIELPAKFRRDQPSKHQSLPPGIRIDHLMYFEFSYHGTLTVIHGIFGYPWNFSGSWASEYPMVREQRYSSRQALAESSRNIILSTRSITVDSCAPAWLVFYYPLAGMINLFICILNNLGAESNIRDIGLLSMGTGFFGYLDYQSDATISFHFIQGLVSWARLAESRAAEQNYTDPLFPALEPVGDTMISEDLDNPNYYGIDIFAMDQIVSEDLSGFVPAFR